MYKAEWQGLTCVVKMFHSAIFPDENAETWTQLGREIELLRQARHPNIVQLIGFVSDPTTNIPSIVMELLDTNLTKLLDKYGVLPLDAQISILHDVAVGLSFLHGHKDPIIHRDLSSNNILLTTHLAAKISDLGLAKHVKSPELQTGSLTGFGTLNYMPPEVLGRQPPQISPKTDIFSFGVIMLQMGTGKYPEVKGDINTEAEVVRRKHHIDLLGIHSHLLPLVRQCLNNNASSRPTGIELSVALKDMKTNTKSVLEIIQTTQKEKDDLQLQLEQRERDVQVVQHSALEMKGQLQREIESLQISLIEEKDKSKEQHKVYTTVLEGNQFFLIHVYVVPGRLVTNLMHHFS